MKKIVLFQKREFKPLEIADWAKAELRRQSRAKLRAEIFLHVRLVFFLLFFAAAFIFMTNSEVEVEEASSMELQRALKHYALADKFRQRALNHEKEVNEIIAPQKP